MVWLSTMKSFSIFLLLSISLESGGSLEKINFETKKIIINDIKIIVEIADNDKKRARGLMYRKNLEKNMGMLFIYPSEASLNFWMKNTFVDLSIGFFNKKTPSN